LASRTPFSVESLIFLADKTPLGECLGEAFLARGTQKGFFLSTAKAKDGKEKVLS
jgi:hypothetical protein